VSLIDATLAPHTPTTRRPPRRLRMTRARSWRRRTRPWRRPPRRWRG